MSSDNLAYLLDRCLTLGNYQLLENGNVKFFTESGDIIFAGYYKSHPVLRDLSLKIWGQKLLDSDFNFLPTEG